MICATMMYEHLQSLSFSFHDEFRDRATDVAYDGLILRLCVTFSRWDCCVAIVALVTFGAITVIILFRLDWHLALVTLISVPILLFLSYEVTQRLRPLWLSVAE